MRLDRGFRNIEIVGDLLVELAVGQHQQHTELLRRQRRQTLRQFCAGVIVGLVQARWKPFVAGVDRRDRLGDGLHRRGLGNESSRAEIARAPHGVGVFTGRYHDHRDRRILRAHEYQRGEAASAGHVEVEQCKLGVRVFRGRDVQGVEAVCLHWPRIRPYARQGADQSCAKQRMIVGDQDRRFAHGRGIQPCFWRSLTKVSTTEGSARVEVSPSAPNSPSAILRRMRRMILPERVFGNDGAN